MLVLLCILTIWYTSNKGDSFDVLIGNQLENEGVYIETSLLRDNGLIYAEVLPLKPYINEIKSNQLSILKTLGGEDYLDISRVTFNKNFKYRILDDKLYIYNNIEIDNLISA